MINAKDIEGEEFTIEQDGNNLKINIPLGLLIFTQENRESPIIIHDECAMIKSFIKYFVDSGRSPYDDEISLFDAAIDGFFDEAIENGETWLEYLEFIENDE